MKYYEVSFKVREDRLTTVLDVIRGTVDELRINMDQNRAGKNTVRAGMHTTRLGKIVLSAAQKHGVNEFTANDLFGEVIAANFKSVSVTPCLSALVKTGHIIRTTKGRYKNGHG